ncbi:MAG: MerR family transcriptional regulator [Myxococcota bacterium]
MPTPLPDKLYFRIGEVSHIVGVEPHVLRYWESEFKGVKPEKSRRGQRVYSRRDVELLLKIRELLYTEQYTIAGARRRLRRGADATPESPGPAAGAVRAELAVIRDALVDGLRWLEGESAPPSGEKPLQ